MKGVGSKFNNNLFSLQAADYAAIATINIYRLAVQVQLMVQA